MELDEKKTKYFVIGIVLLILLGIVLIVHFNNKSLVSGDKDKNNTTKKTTTEVKTTEVTTTKKRNTVKQVSNVVEEVKEENIYKSIIDDDNKIVYNYKLTNEILDGDKLVSKKLEVNEYLKNNNVIGLFDISLYSSDNIKKSVSNSLINVSIPLTGDLIGYDSYKVIYVNDNGVIADEIFDTNVIDGYIKFSTTHLSMYGIVGVKNNNNDNKPVEEVVDLTNVIVDVLQNGNVVKEQSVVASVNDVIDVRVNNITSEYKVYYALKNDINKDNLEYKEFVSGTIFNGNTPNKVTLSIKIVSLNTEKVFELNEFNIYDVVYNYDRNSEEKKYDENNNEVQPSIGEVKEDNKDLKNVDDNQNIVVKDVTGENVTLDKEKQATININGNAYLVDKTDITNMKFNGYLVIDTDKEIKFEDKIDMSGLYQITIKSKEFDFNGIKYTYEIIDGKVVIKKVIENTEETTKSEEEISNDVFDDNFDGDVIIETDNENNLIIKKNEIKDNPEILNIDQNPEEVSE